MKHAWLILIVFAVVLGACTPSAQPTAIPTLSFSGNGSNNSRTSAPSSDANSVSASAVVVPVQHVDLAFATTGRVTAVNVKAGDQVAAGQTLVTKRATRKEEYT